MLIAPSEGSTLKTLGRPSALPEKFGCDVLAKVPAGWFGVQRKEISDFIASLHDGRLSVERAQMKRLQSLGGVCLLIIEGKPRWTTDGVLLKDHGKPFTRNQLRRYIASVQAQGIWVEQTDNVTDTVDCIRSYAGWLSKTKHTPAQRPGPTAMWGKPTNREWLIHLLSGFPGIGATTAAALIDHFGGTVPLRWVCERGELAKVPGVGVKRAAALWEALYFVVPVRDKKAADEVQKNKERRDKAAVKQMREVVKAAHPSGRKGSGQKTRGNLGKGTSRRKPTPIRGRVK